MRRAIRLLPVLCLLAVPAVPQGTVSLRAPKLHAHMRRLLEEHGPMKGWVFFGDKGVFGETARNAALLEAAQALTPRALERRSRRRSAASLVDERDLPLAADYVRGVLASGAELSVESRWLNAISVRGSLAQFREIERLPYVDRIEPVRRGVLVDGVESSVQVDVPLQDASPSRAGAFYGASEAQLEQLNLVTVHGRGYTGDGIVIGVLDTGFHRGHEAFNQSGHVVNVLAEYDFVDDDGNTGIEAGDPSNQHSHGTYILGTLAAYQPGTLVGAAYDASYVLAKTEDVSNEYQQEEDFYVAGLEFVENNGADLATSSLGYIDWYTQADLDGLTAVTTMCVNVATANGMVCLTAAGNSGNDASAATSALIAPADAFEVITVGAVDSGGTIAGFSSDGPTADGRVKPELLAWGVSTATVCAFTDVGCTTAVNGTSLSTPLLAGLVACLMEAYPDWTVGQFRQRLFRTGDYFQANSAPDPLFVQGFGIPDAEDAGFDCNGNGMEDAIDLITLASCDCNSNGAPDECDIADGVSLDGNSDGRPDECANQLSASPSSLSASGGGSQGFCLDAGIARAGQRYLLLGTTSGTTPGFRLGDLRVPLNVDAYTRLAFGGGSASPLSASNGTLDSQGRATAELTVPPGSALFLAGATVHHAFLVWDAAPPAASGAGAAQVQSSGARFSFVSNVVSLAIEP